VDELVDTSTWQYAVISVRSESSRERLVIAYPDEETLRDLIAAPSIVALGYTSRADALKNIDRCVTTKASLKRLLKAASLHPNMTFLTECRVALRRLAGGFGLWGLQKSCVISCTTVSLRFSSSSTREIYCPRQFGPLSLFSITWHPHQQSQRTRASLHFLRSFRMAP
jgi:hypothetical protein